GALRSARMRRARSSTAWHPRSGRSASRRSRRPSSRRRSRLRKRPTSSARSTVVRAAAAPYLSASHKMTGAGVAKSGFAKEQLRSFVERVERLEEERAALTADIREVYSEAKGLGFDSKIMRQVVRMRKLDKADFQEQEAMLDLYLTAMDMR